MKVFVISAVDMYGTTIKAVCSSLENTSIVLIKLDLTMGDVTIVELDKLILSQQII